MTAPERRTIQFGDTEIAYTVVRSRRRKKTIQITIDREHGVLVASPLRTSLKVIADVVRTRANWIMRASKAASSSPERQQLVTGESLPYLGRNAPLVVVTPTMTGATVGFINSTFEVAVQQSLEKADRRAAIAKALERWYRRRAAECLEAKVSQWALGMALNPKRVLIRGQKRRWGSCSLDGTLRFNWRLVQLTPSLIDYVVVHELAHLRVPNHSPLFWESVAVALPDFKLRRKQLRQDGASVGI
jgi:predicted metal-dependent hydrolase